MTTGGERLAEVVPLRAVGSVEAARCYLHEHVSEQISLASLARLVGLSPFHLVRAFQREVGTPPHRYLVDLRMARAKELLGGSELAVTDVCRMVGFTTLSHFGSTFRRRVGMSPTGYRRWRKLEGREPGAAIPPWHFGSCTAEG